MFDERFNTMTMLEKAVFIAVYYHSGQKDKGGNDYIIHPLSVMAKVDKTEEKIVAVLHDIIEDTEITEEDLNNFGFSTEIIEAILSLTRKEDEDYLSFIKRVKLNPIGKIVKIADIENNMDLSRIKHLTVEDYIRLERYREALKVLKE